jgi:methyl-accepting chemotaxis protein
MTIRSRLLSLGIGVMVAVAAMTGITYVGARAMMKAQLDELGRVSAEAGAQSVERYLKERSTILSVSGANVEHLVAQSGRDRTKILDYLTFWSDRTKNLGFLGLYMTFADKDYYDGTGWVPPADYVPTERPWYRAAMAANRLVFTDPYIDAQTGNPVVTIARPLKGSDGTPPGVIAADVTVKDMSDFVSGRKILGLGYGIIVGPDGTILAHPKKKYAMKLRISETSSSVPPELALAGKAMTEGKRGGGAYTFEGERRRIFYLPLENGWSLGLIAPEKQIMAPVRALVYKQLGAAGAALLLIVLLLLSVSRSILRPIRRLQALAETVGAGDLTFRADLTGEDELARAGRAIDEAFAAQQAFFLDLSSEGRRMAAQADSLNDVARTAESMVETIRERSREVRTVADDNAEAIQAGNAGVQEVASSAQGAARAAAEAAQAAEELRKNAQDAEGLVRENTDRVDRMSRSFGDVAEAVKKLNDQASEIGGFVATISGIADQTNLLALNAAIEAARAGEAGRGFAVVAEEVRKLAEESNSAAGRIGELVGTIVGGTASAVEAASKGVETARGMTDGTDRMQERLGQIIAAVEHIVDQIQSVAATAQEQSAASEEMAASIDRITRGAERTREGVDAIADEVAPMTRCVEGLTGAAEELDRIVKGFESHLARYRLEGEPATPSAPQG